MGADFAYMGTRFIATEEANASAEYKQALVDSQAEDIVYTNLFTGVHGNYLRSSIVKAGLDPEALPVADKTKMNFGSGGNTKSKAWRDIWGSGQGVADIHEILPVSALVDRLESEYRRRKRTAGPATRQHSSKERDNEACFPCSSLLIAFAATAGAGGGPADRERHGRLAGTGAAAAEPARADPRRPHRSASASSASRPRQTRRKIDGSGKFLTPGLMDSHVHVSDAPAFRRCSDDPAIVALREAYLRQQPRSYLYFGVTQLLDLMAFAPRARDLREPTACDPICFTAAPPSCSTAIRRR